MSSTRTPLTTVCLQSFLGPASLPLPACVPRFFVDLENPRGYVYVLDLMCTSPPPPAALLIFPLCLYWWHDLRFQGCILSWPGSANTAL